MVVVYECFPSNNELVNKARQSYRASLLSQLENDIEPVDQSSPADDSSSLKTIFSETQANSGKS